MKNSDLYHLAQVAVVQSPNIAPENKIEILKKLLGDENLALLCENREENENGKSV